MSTKRAEDVYRSWHDKEPKKVVRKSNKLLDEPFFCCIGRGLEITYISDKWEKDGDWWPYVHDFESRPKVYLPQSRVSDEERMGAPVKTRSLIGSGVSKGQLPVALLGTVDELAVLDRNNEETTLDIGKRPPLYSTPDKKGLLIITRSTPILIRGGAMRVTSKGIVK